MKIQKRRLTYLLAWILVLMFIFSSCAKTKKLGESSSSGSQSTESSRFNPTGGSDYGNVTTGSEDAEESTEGTQGADGTDGNHPNAGGQGQNGSGGNGGAGSSNNGSGNGGGSVSNGSTPTKKPGENIKAGENGGGAVDTGFKRKDKNVAEAQLQPVQGINRLFIDGKQVDPIILAGDNFSGTNDIKSTVAGRQTMKAVSNGSVKLIRVLVDVYANNPYKTALSVNESIKNLNLIDKDTYVLMYFRSWEPDVTIFGGDPSYDGFVDQNGKKVALGSMASEKYLAHSKKLLSNLIDAVMANAAASNKVIGYFPSGNGVEWFLPADGIYDCSGAAQVKFRAFLKTKYKTDAALRTAWGDNNVSLSSVTIPKDVQGGRGTNSKHKTTLYLKASDQKYVDFFDYYNDILSNFILEMSAVAKQKTANRSLVGYYYGYNFEDYTSTPLSGIFDMEKILTSPNLDFLAGPVSYSDRNAGGNGMSMSLLSSVTANGKLWIDESDYRSPNITAPGNDNLGVGLEGGIDNMAQMLEISKRQMGKQMIYNSGTWWLDLIGKGWWDHTGFWDTQKQLSNLYTSYASMKKAQTPEVALVYDSRAVSLLADAWQTSVYLYHNIRTDINKTGLSFGLYTQQDVINGKANGAKLYIMMTPWRINSTDVSKLKPVLHKQGTTTLWLYGNGQTSTADFAALSGMTLSLESASSKKALDMNLNSAGKSKFPTMASSLKNPSAYQRYHVSGGGAQTLAAYASGGKVSMAAMEKDGWKSVFYGGLSLPTSVIVSLAGYAGANVYKTEGDVTYIDNNLVVMHTTNGGTKTLKFPAKCDVYDYFNKKWYTGVSEIKVNVNTKSTYYYFYGSKSEFQKHGIGK